jgi:enolase-phosphatase E1
LIDPPGTRVLLLDVEGTTTSVSFVYDVLFPCARARLEAYLRAAAHDAAARADLDALRAERQAEADPEAPPWRAATFEEALDSAIGYARWLMDRDRKSTALKAVQGRIWQAAYAEGTLTSHVYADVRPAFERWRARGLRLAIFSSGSVLAQRLLFAHTAAGDLTPTLDAYFDTTTGPKREAASYHRIAAALGEGTAAVLFLSDVAAELDAARAAGMSTGLCLRDGRAAPASDHPVLRSFDEVCP